MQNKSVVFIDIFLHFIRALLNVERVGNDNIQRHGHRKPINGDGVQIQATIFFFLKGILKRLVCKSCRIFFRQVGKLRIFEKTGS